MNRVIGMCLLQVLLATGGFAHPTGPEVGPINPDFMEYMTKLQNGEDSRFSVDGRALGYVPPPVMIRADTPAGFDRDRLLPAVYDLRDEGMVTSVKDQGTCGSCWAFATCGSIEARWLETGFPEYDLSENNLNYGHGFEWVPCEGGNAVLSTAYLSRGDGPILEADDPYQGENGSYHPGLTPVAYIPDARFLPPDPMVLKQTVYDFGAITTNMWWDQAYYNSTNYTYYCNLGGDPETNHCVLIAGWDDNLVTAGGVGAWIIKNSWGPGFGDDGYFFISYQDVRVNGFNAFWPNRDDYNPNATIHFYDRLGWVFGYGWSDDTDYAMTKFEFSGDERITRIGTWVNSSDATIGIDVFANFDGSSPSTPLGSIPDQNCLFPGYYTFDLPSPLDVHSGSAIYVKVKYHTPDYQYSIPVEGALEGYAVPEIETGKGWVSTDGANGSWFEIGNNTEDRKYDPCIKLCGISGSGPGPATVLEEGFESGAFPPDGWSATVTNIANTWRQGNPQDHPFSDIDPNSQYSAICPWVAQDQDEWLISPPFALTAAPATLEFYAGHSTTWLSNATLKLYITENNGNSWTRLWEAENDGGAWQWRQVVLDLSAYVGGSGLKLGWQYVGNDGDLVGLDGVVLEVESLPTNELPELSRQFVLHQNYPNPFGTETVIRYSISEPDAGKAISLGIYNLDGRLVRTLFKGRVRAGIHSIDFDGKGEGGQSISSGAYFYRLDVGEESLTRKMVFCR